MTATDPKREFAVEVVRRLQEAGYQALWAGGCVRDFLLGRTPGDYDVATNALPDEVRRVFGHRRTLTVGAVFGVIIVRGSRTAGHVEVATFRTDLSYLDGRRPSAVEFSSPEEDAQRRDFTINGMFYDPIARHVLDYVGGEQDLSAGIVRAIGDPHDRMREDKLRMLRAVRFTASLEFQLDPTTADAIREMAAEIHVVSAERIGQELKKMLIDTHRRRAVELAHEVGLLTQVVPEFEPVLHENAGHCGDPAVSSWEATLRMLKHLQEPGFELAAAALLHAIPDAVPASGVEAVREICRRMRLSNQETDHIAWLVEHQDDLADAPRLSPAQLKRILAYRFRRDLLALTHVKALACNADLTPFTYCEEFLQSTPDEEINPPPLLTGDLLIAAGYRPGPQFKKWLEAIRDAQLNGEIATTGEALELVARLQAESPGDKKSQH